MLPLSSISIKLYRLFGYAYLELRKKRTQCPLQCSPLCIDMYQIKIGVKYSYDYIMEH